MDEVKGPNGKFDCCKICNEAHEQYLSPTTRLTATVATILLYSSHSDHRSTSNAYYRASSMLQAHPHHQFHLKLLEIDNARREEARLSLLSLEHPHDGIF
ncbi:conserved hypothetical protein [Ricinus communis]|uniref:Uncharacterized protein n=1 Tax=Ricinus communis TaxID=3988 RepID=B9S3R1_RICCO|nr:conserved hypothetical protein [Ricinus communis]